MPLPTPDVRTGFITRSFTMPIDLSCYLTGILLELGRVNAWEAIGTRTPQDCADVFDALALQENDMVGSVIGTIGQLPANGLWCNGQSVSVTDYPVLASVIDPQFIIGDLIVLPDLAGVFLYGGSLVGVTGGEETHTLTIEEIPMHDHGEHTHLPIQASGEIPTQVPDVPIPDPLSSRGGGLPHNNMPPYFTVKYYIIAF